MKVTPRHNKFIEAIADSPIHVIATMRGKDQYEIDKSEGGKMNVKKLGVGAKQRDGFEYEFTATFLIDQKTNLAEPQKDNTHLFEHEGAVILTEDHGKKIIRWANSGEGYTPPVRSAVETKTKEQENPSNDVLSAQKDKVVEIIKSSDESQREQMLAFMNEKFKTKNPNKITSIEDLEILYTKFEEIKNNKENK